MTLNKRSEVKSDIFYGLLGVDFLYAVYLYQTSRRHNKVTQPFYLKYAKIRSLTLNERSEVKSEIFYRLLGVDFLYAVSIYKTSRTHNNKVTRPLIKICQNSTFFCHNFAKNENFKNPKRRAPTHTQNTPVGVNIAKIGPAVTEKRLRTDGRTHGRTHGQRRF